MSNPESPDVTTNQPAVPTSKKADKSTLVKGCAIGCGVLIVIVILLGVAAFVGGKSMMNKGAVALGERLSEDYATMLDTGQVPEEHAALYQEIVDYAAREDAGFFSVVLCVTVVQSHLEDNAVDPPELQEATETRDFLRDNPGAGMFAVDRFMNERENLKRRAESVMQNLPSVFAPR